jgi:hypothetical protein
VCGQSFLVEHQATLVSDGAGWALTYPIACYHEYSARFEQSVEIAIPIAARNYDVALLIAEVILREHVAPRAPEPEAHPWTPPALPTGRHMLLGQKAA